MLVDNAAGVVVKSKRKIHTEKQKKVVTKIVMKTIIKKVSVNPVIPEEYREAARILRAGGLVAFPTETVYGLGGDGLLPEASAKIYAAKGRPSDNPLIIHIADIERLKLLSDDVPQEAYILAKKFWPGPLTMILPKGKNVPRETTGGLDTVAVRMPSHPAALALIRESGVCIAAPSANASGRPSPTSAEHVAEDLSGRIDMILDGGSVNIGIESTIVDLTAGPPMILRPGYISREMLKEVLENVCFDPAVLEGNREKILRPRAPGMKYRHYAPKGELTIFRGEQEKVAEAIKIRSSAEASLGKRVGIIATEETKDIYGADSHNILVKSIGKRSQEDSVARGLYRILREFDHEGVEVILAESFDGGRLGQAIMNRMLKAAGNRVEYV